MPYSRTNLDYVDEEIDQETAIFRGEEPPLPAERKPNWPAAVELLLGGAAVGLVIVAVIAALEAATSGGRRTPRRR